MQSKKVQNLVEWLHEHGNVFVRKLPRQNRLIKGAHILQVPCLPGVFPVAFLNIDDDVLNLLADKNLTEIWDCMLVRSGYEAILENAELAESNGVKKTICFEICGPPGVGKCFVCTCLNLFFFRSNLKYFL